MRLFTTALAVLTFVPLTAWGEDTTYDEIVEKMEGHQRQAERLDLNLSNRLKELAADNKKISDKDVRGCINIALDLQSAARKRISDGLQVRVAMTMDGRPQEELTSYKYAASQIFYAAARDIESVLSKLDSCIVASEYNN